ncbi:MAG: ubiquinol-cytochrome c reductase iron-sulfur subunit [Sinobacteraceae bacterium]|nr:ubiquinol-cytochrome c reductase iron-sulfur subunit [Nevskia sp.]MDI3258869.1 ubiquinol-cytochrome c reductase iron-sulfur subunit [Nevskiaceae bacterium]
MSNEGVDGGRRRFLTAATSVVGAAGAVAAVWPFLASLKPSAKALALGAPVAADIGKLEEGQQVIFVWQGLNIWVLRRSKDMIASLSQVRPRLADPNSDYSQQPEYCKNEHRSIKPEYLVMNAKCTHLGCMPELKAQHPDVSVDPDWLGGYLCPCHGSRYDLSGRVFQSQPAPLNMMVPPYRYASDTMIIIGEDPKKS